MGIENVEEYLRAHDQNQRPLEVMPPIETDAYIASIME
jgi:hypothetical protein